MMLSTRATGAPQPPQHAGSTARGTTNLPPPWPSARRIGSLENSESNSQTFNTLYFIIMHDVL